MAYHQDSISALQNKALENLSGTADSLSKKGKIMRKYTFRVKPLTTDLINYSVTPKSLVPWTLLLKVKHKLYIKEKKVLTLTRLRENKRFKSKNVT